MRQIVAGEHAFSAETTGNRTLAESGRESKFFSASGIATSLMRINAESECGKDALIVVPGMASFSVEQVHKKIL
jgi:hypothetical protein